MAGARPRRRSDADDRDDEEEGRDRSKRRRGSSGDGGRVVLIVVAIAVALVVGLPLVGGAVFLIWRIAAPGATPFGVPSINQPGGSGVSRLIGQWQMPHPEMPAQVLLLDVRKDDVTVRGGSNIPFPVTSTYEVMREGPDSVHLRIRPSNDPQHTYEWDIRFLGDGRIQVTSTEPNVPVRTYTRNR